MSEWKKESNKRKDERNTKIDDNNKSKNKKKNTKKWCKGKAGQEHTPKCMPYSKYIGLKGLSTCRELVCTKCSKILDIYIPLLGRNKKPAWVTEDEMGS